MRKYLAAIGAGVLVCLGGVAGAQTARDGTMEPMSVPVQFGTETNQMVITPNVLVLKEGQLYRLVLENPSDVTHYFTPLDFGQAVKTRTVEVTGGQIRGTRNYGGRLPQFATPYRLQEIELRPGGSADWVIEPVKTGTYDFQCDAPAHANAGMVGKIVVN